MILYFFASLVPLGLLVRQARPLCARSWRELEGPAIALFLILGAALYVNHPFLQGTALGTGEAYNYSLSTADAVSQFRAGHFPVLVGESEYAFNGRVHPLRTAPLLSYAAGLVDLLSLRRLSFWSIQDLVLALSLLGGALSAYRGILQVMPSRPRASALLALAYLFCPAVLAAAYSMDLYMTVVALPFLPMVVAGNTRLLSNAPPLTAYLQISAGLAATWWAHPPVALWLTLSTGIFQLGRIVSGRVSLKDLGRLALAGGLAGALSLFVFVSAFSIARIGPPGGGGAVEAVLASIHSAFAASLRPISATADQLGDFQWGYAHWLLFLLVMLVAAVQRNRGTLLLGLTAAALLALTTPVPGLTRAFWEHAPSVLIAITSQWPMQRLYLVACVWMLFAVAHSWRDFQTLRRPPSLRALATILVLAAVGWTASQAGNFIHRAEQILGEKASVSADLHRSENLQLTVTSYAFFQTPPSFMHAVMDPERELRLLQRGTAEPLLTNWEEPSPALTEVAGTFVASAASGDIVSFEPRLQLNPGVKYRLDWSFLVPPSSGTLRVVGEHLRREYPLPQAGNERGFGMLPVNQHSITLWSSAPEGDNVQIELIGFPRDVVAQDTRLADFKLTRVDPAQLPLRILTLVPLRVEVNAPAPAYLETPRMFLAGYRAQVGGKETPAICSPEGRVMVPVPAGHSIVKLRYPGTLVVNTAFWISFASWCGLAAVLSARAGFPAGFTRLAKLGQLRLPPRPRGRVALLGLGGIAVAGLLLYFGNRSMEGAGPVRIRLLLPRGETSRSHPLLTAGPAGAATFVYVVYQDATHIRVGFDAWGKNAAMSDPIEIDYFVDHTFLISLPALYPKSHWQTRDATAEQLQRLRERVIVTLDGRTVLDEKTYPFPATAAELTIGLNRIGGSTTEPKFSGLILENRRAGPSEALQSDLR